MRKFRSSRWKQLIFPHELIIDKFHVLARKRHFPAFWRVTEESIPLSKLASIQIHRGFLFSKLIIENSGGPFPIIVRDLWNGTARQARDLLELIEREMMRSNDIAKLVNEGGDYRGNPPGDGGGSGGGGSPRDNSPTDENRYNAYSIENFSARSGNTSNISRDRNQSSIFITEAARTYPPIIHTTASAASHAESKTSRNFGDLPSNDWNPPAPWNPVPLANAQVKQPEETREINPVEFLNTETKLTTQSTALETRPDKSRQTAVEQLANWWQKALSRELENELKQAVRRKKRKLN